MPLQLSKGKKSTSVRVGEFSSAIPKEKVVVYGKNCSMYEASYPPGYHTKPHCHESEQMNYVLEGEIWLFVNKKAYLLKKGDFHRVPTLAPHWAWNKSDGRCTLIQVHSPGMQADKSNKEIAVPLFEDGEEIATSGSPINMPAKEFLPEWVVEAESLANGSK